MSADFGAEILRWFAGWILLAAGTGKLRAFASFRANLGASFGVAPRHGALLAPAIVGAELLLAVLVVGPFARAGMVAALLLFALFTAVLAWRLRHDGALRCDCFGQAERNLSGYDLLRNVLVMAGIALFLALPAGPALPLGASLLAAGLASILAVLAIDLHDVIDLFEDA